MSDFDRLNEYAGSIMGWTRDGTLFKRDAGDGFVEFLPRLPAYCESLIAAWQLVDYAAAKNVEYHLFMTNYGHKHIYMASFLKGTSQRSSSDEHPCVATVKAFISMFSPQADDNGEHPLTKKPN